MYRTLAIIRWLGNKLDVMAREDPSRLAQIVTNEVEEATRPIKARQQTITSAKRDPPRTRPHARWPVPVAGLVPARARSLRQGVRDHRQPQREDAPT